MNAPEYLMLILAYFLGSIPIGLLVARIFYHRDIRKEGSGNIGATNALRQFGTKVGVFVLIMDMMKGVGALLLARHFWGLAHPLVSVCGLLVILGHVFSIWLKFKGGKGVATAAGVFAALAPMSLIIAVLVFILVVVRSRYVSLGSILAAVVFAICTYLMELLSPKPDWGLLILTALIVLMIVFRHIENIKRLVKGEENKISFSKRGRS